MGDAEKMSELLKKFQVLMDEIEHVVQRLHAFETLFNVVELRCKECGFLFKMKK
jgi:predicted Zn-ribbon and HTH transcriptional regulator